MEEKTEDPECLDERICPKGVYTEVVIREKDFAPKEPTFLLGFAGLGLVSSIAVNHLLEKVKDFKQIGFVHSTKMPPMVPFYDGVLRQPFRIYFSPSINLIVAFSEVPWKSKYYIDLSNALMHWALKMSVKDVVLIQGLATNNPFPPDQYPVYCAAEKEVFGKLKEHGVELLPKGIIMGIEAAILINCLNSRLDGYALVTPVAGSGIPSPEASAAILKLLGSIYSIDIDVTELEEQGKEIRKRYAEIAEVTRQQLEANSMDEGIKTQPRESLFI
ncbi:MAG: hypothetical protein Kow0069_35530 [Promethearchaeota archaeon]